VKITLEELQAFIAVLDSGSVTAAADQLNQTTSGISRALGRLEKKLDTTLLRRTTRRMELTEEGSAFLLHAREILQSVDEAEEQMALRRAVPVGLLRVNAASPFMEQVLVPMIAGFRQRYPQIELELHTDNHVINLLEKRTDVAIRIGDLPDSTLHARLLGSSQLRVLASPAYLAKHGTPTEVEQLAEHCLLGFTQPESLNLWPLRTAQLDHYAIKADIVASSGQTLRQLALQGVGIVQLADFMTRDDQRSGNLVPLLDEFTLCARQPINAVYYRNTQLAARITCFLDYVSEQLTLNPL